MPIYITEVNNQGELIRLSNVVHSQKILHRFWINFQGSKNAQYGTVYVLILSYKKQQLCTVLRTVGVTQLADDTMSFGTPDCWPIIQ